MKLHNFFAFHCKMKYEIFDGKIFSPLILHIFSIFPRPGKQVHNQGHCVPNWISKLCNSFLATVRITLTDGSHKRIIVAIQVLILLSILNLIFYEIIAGMLNSCLQFWSKLKFHKFICGFTNFKHFLLPVRSSNVFFLSCHTRSCM